MVDQIDEKDPIRKWRKIGGGSLRWPEKGLILKQNEIFYARESELPPSVRRFSKPAQDLKRQLNRMIAKDPAKEMSSLQELPEVVYVLCGGPSLAEVDLSLLEGQAVIAVNRAYEIYPKASILYFADFSFFEEHEDRLKESPIAPKVTVCQDLKHISELTILRRSPELLDSRKGFLAGSNSGAMAINLAAHLGANLIVPLGLDMREDGGKTHWHDGYTHSSKPKTCEEMLAGMKGLRVAVQKRFGADILHGTPGSAFDEVDYCPIEEIIERTRHLRYYGGWWLPKEELHFVDMLRRSRPAEGRLTYQYYNKHLPALQYLADDPRKIAVDIGSNLGFWSWYLSKEFSRVHCFEPIPLHNECWKYNHVGVDNVSLHECGLSNERAELPFVSPQGSCGGTHVAEEGEGVLLPVRTLDSFRLNNVSFLKVDCEGYELPILQGAEKTLKRNKPIIVVEQKSEWDGRYPYPPLGAVSFLQSLGAKVYEEIAGDYIMGWK